MSLDVNFVAVLAAAVVAFVIGGVWYTFLFGKQWRMLMGVPEGATMQGAKMSMAQSMTGNFVATVVMVFVLANFLPIGGTGFIGAALTRAFLIWLGFIATIQLNAIWYENRPWKLYVINASHYLVAMLAAALVLSWWPW